MSRAPVVSQAQARRRPHLVRAAAAVLPAPVPFRGSLTAAQSRRAEIAQRSTIQQAVDRRPRCCYCAAVITDADIHAYHAEGAPLDQLPACCTACADSPEAP